jgi:hypothetical protein
MGRSTFSGPVKSTNGFEVGSSGTQLSLIKKGTVSVTVSALAAAAEEDITLSISDAVAGDIVILTPPNAAAETGLAKLLEWVSASGSVKLRVGNVSGSSLTGSTADWNYILIRSA